MEAKGSDEDDLYNNLNEAIMKSITSSDEVRGILQKMQKAKLINKSEVLNLLLSLEDLESEMNSQTFSKSSSCNIESLKDIPRNAGLTDSDIQRHRVDGTPLSENEIMFEDYFRGKFDAKEWLKKARIKI